MIDERVIVVRFLFVRTVALRMYRLDIWPYGLIQRSNRFLHTKAHHLEIMACEEKTYADPPHWAQECRMPSQDRDRPISLTDPFVPLLPSAHIMMVSRRGNESGLTDMKGRLYFNLTTVPASLRSIQNTGKDFER